MRQNRRTDWHMNLDWIMVQQLGNDQVGADGVDLLAQEDDAVVEQARIGTPQIYQDIRD